MQRAANEFLTWWIQQLADLIPERWRQFGSASGDALLIAPVGSLAGGVDAAEVSLRRNGRQTPLGRFALASIPQQAGKPVVLQLAETDVLSKTISLPLAAERDLDQVLGFEMDRETPFGAEELFWNHRIEERDRQHGRLLVRLVLVPRASLAALLGALARAGIAPKRAEIAGATNRDCDLPLAAGADRRPDRTGKSRLRWLAVGCCAALALAVVVTPFIRQGLALGEIDQQLDEGRQAAAKIEQLRKEIARLSGRVELIDNQRDKAGRPLATLAALTRLIPDDTYLTEFQQQQHKVTVSGRSASASRLIGALAASDRVHNPSFAAPVTRIEAIKAEAFTITAEVTP